MISNIKMWLTSVTFLLRGRPMHKDHGSPKHKGFGTLDHYSLKIPEQEHASLSGRISHLQKFVVTHPSENDVSVVFTDVYILRWPPKGLWTVLMSLSLKWERKAMIKTSVMEIWAGGKFAVFLWICDLHNYVTVSKTPRYLAVLLWQLAIVRSPVCPKPLVSWRQPWPLILTCSSSRASDKGRLGLIFPSKGQQLFLLLSREQR